MIINNTEIDLKYCDGIKLSLVSTGSEVEGTANTRFIAYTGN